MRTWMWAIFLVAVMSLSFTARALPFVDSFVLLRTYGILSQEILDLKKTIEKLEKTSKRGEIFRNEVSDSLKLIENHARKGRGFITREAFRHTYSQICLPNQPVIFPSQFMEAFGLSLQAAKFKLADYTEKQREIEELWQKGASVVVDPAEVNYWDPVFAATGSPLKRRLFQYHPDLNLKKDLKSKVEKQIQTQLNLIYRNRLSILESFPYEKELNFIFSIRDRKQISFWDGLFNRGAAERWVVDIDLVHLSEGEEAETKKRSVVIYLDRSGKITHPDAIYRALKNLTKKTIHPRSFYSSPTLE